MATFINVPGTDVRAQVIKARYAPGWWSYVLFNGEGDYIGSDAIEIPDGVTSEQVARIAFLLEVEYAGT